MKTITIKYLQKFLLYSYFNGGIIDFDVLSPLENLGRNLYFNSNYNMLSKLIWCCEQLYQTNLLAKWFKIAI